jgi:hypothetical protein
MEDAEAKTGSYHGTRTEQEMGRHSLNVLSSFDCRLTTEPVLFHFLPEALDKTPIDQVGLLRMERRSNEERHPRKCVLTLGHCEDSTEVMVRLARDDPAHPSVAPL